MIKYNDIEALEKVLKKDKNIDDNIMVEVSLADSVPLLGIYVYEMLTIVILLCNLQTV